MQKKGNEICNVFLLLIPYFTCYSALFLTFVSVFFFPPIISMSVFLFLVQLCEATTSSLFKHRTFDCCCSFTPFLPQNNHKTVLSAGSTRPKTKKMKKVSGKCHFIELIVCVCLLLCSVQISPVHLRCPSILEQTKN